MLREIVVILDCVPVAFPGFHQKLLRGKTVAIACLKLDDPRGYLEKLTEMIRANDLQDITVAHMKVPCCSGLLRMALTARRASGADIPVIGVVIGAQGEILTRSEVTDEADWSRRPSKSATRPHYMSEKTHVGA